MIYRKILISAAIAVALTGCNEEPMQAQQPQSTDVATPVTAFTTQKQKYSYAMGARLAELLKGQMDADVDSDAIAAAITDVFSGGEMQLSDSEMKAAIVEHTKAAQLAKVEAGKASIAKGAEFLADNAGKEGVITLDSGLQYKEVRAGEGDSPTDSDTVKVHYKGMLIDGTVFDSSYKRGKPTSFSLGGVIPGFKEALAQMKPGGKSIAYIPSSLGYGERGAGGNIGPNETLIFEIELIEVTSVEVTPAK